jgi:hypothetical protein
LRRLSLHSTPDELVGDKKDQEGKSRPWHLETKIGQKKQLSARLREPNEPTELLSVPRRLLRRIGSLARSEATRSTTLAEVTKESTRGRLGTKP